MVRRQNDDCRRVLEPAENLRRTAARIDEPGVRDDDGPRANGGCFHSGEIGSDHLSKVSRVRRIEVTGNRGGTNELIVHSDSRCQGYRQGWTPNSLFNR